MSVRAQPDGYHTITPFFTVKDADRFIDFIGAAFGAETTEMMRTPDGRIGHAEARIGDSPIMIADGATMPSAMYLYLPDVNAVYAKALRAGAASEQEPQDQFWGDRQAAVKDAWGNMWFLATHVEDVSPEELQRRAAAAAQVPA